MLSAKRRELFFFFFYFFLDSVISYLLEITDLYHAICLLSLSAGIGPIRFNPLENSALPTLALLEIGFGVTNMYHNLSYLAHDFNGNLPSFT